MKQPEAAEDLGLANSQDASVKEVLWAVLPQALLGTKAAEHAPAKTPLVAPSPVNALSGHPRRVSFAVAESRHSGNRAFVPESRMMLFMCLLQVGLPK